MPVVEDSFGKKILNLDEKKVKGLIKIKGGKCLAFFVCMWWCVIEHKWKKWPINFLDVQIPCFANGT